MPKKFTFTPRIDRSHPKSAEKCCVYIIFECSHDAVSKMCRVEFRFLNLPFSKSAWKKMCRFRINGRPIRHIFHRFQNVPASCERSVHRAFEQLYIAVYMLRANFIHISDLLLDVIRQMTDIKDKDREIVKKLENASYRKFAFRQVRSSQLSNSEYNFESFATLITCHALLGVFALPYLRICLQSFADKKTCESMLD